MPLRRIILPAVLLFLAACDSSTVQSSALSVKYVVEGTGATLSYAGASGTEHATTSGRWEHQFEAEPGAVVLLDAVSTSSNPVTGTIFLNGEMFRLERGLRVHLEGSASSSQSGEVEVRGFIEARAANQITILGRTFVVDDQTLLLGRSNESVAFDAFRLGDFIEAEGRAQNDGTLRATKLKLENGDEADEIEVEGFIEELTESSATVQGLLFIVDDRTRFLDDDNNPIPFDSFQVGDRVEAEGFARPDGTYYAEKLKHDDH